MSSPPSSSVVRLQSARVPPTAAQFEAFRAELVAGPSLLERTLQAVDAQRTAALAAIQPHPSRNNTYLYLSGLLAVGGAIAAFMGARAATADLGAWQSPGSVVAAGVGYCLGAWLAERLFERSKARFERQESAARDDATYQEDAAVADAIDSTRDMSRLSDMARAARAESVSLIANVAEGLINRKVDRKAMRNYASWEVRDLPLEVVERAARYAPLASSLATFENVGAVLLEKAYWPAGEEWVVVRRIDILDEIAASFAKLTPAEKKAVAPVLLQTVFDDRGVVKSGLVETPRVAVKLYEDLRTEAPLSIKSGSAVTGFVPTRPPGIARFAKVVLAFTDKLCTSVDSAASLDQLNKLDGSKHGCSSAALAEAVAYTDRAWVTPLERAGFAQAASTFLGLLNEASVNTCDAQALLASTIAKGAVADPAMRAEAEQLFQAANALAKLGVAQTPKERAAVWKHVDEKVTPAQAAELATYFKDRIFDSSTTTPPYDDAADVLLQLRRLIGSEDSR